MTNWKEYKFSDFVDINPKVALKKDVEYSFVEMKDLSEGCKYVIPSQKCVLKGGSRFESGDTLFARITPCLENGKISQVKELENGVGFGSTEFLIFRGRKGISNTDFVYYLSLSDDVRGFAEQNMVGTSGRQRVSWQAFENLILNLPDLPTQTAIAEILSSLDDKIELNNKINQELENLAQTLFKQWFIDFEFPNEKGEPYKSSGGAMVDSELGQIPKGWEVVSFKDTIEKYIDNRGKTPPVISDGIPIVEVKHMSDSSIFPSLKTQKFVSQEVYENWFRAYLEEDDLLMSTVGTIGRLNITPKDEIFAIAQNVLGLRFKKEILTQLYMFCLMRSKLFNDEINSRLIITVQASIKRSDLEKIPVVIPDYSILNNFDIQVRTLFDEISNLTKENQELTNLRDMLLPKLISGVLEVSEVMAEKA